MWNFQQNQDYSQGQGSNLGWNVAPPINVNNNNAGQSANLGWNLGGSTAAPPYPPQMPSHYPPSIKDQSVDDENTVREEFAKKEAGAMSFAHYIVKFVSPNNFLLFLFLT